MNPIGINWAAVWDDTVWDPVWLQAAVVTTEDDDKPKRRVRSRITRKPPVVKKPKSVRKARAKKAKLAQVVAQAPVLTPAPVLPTPIEAFAATLSPLAPLEAELRLSLQGCGMSGSAELGNSATMSAPLEGAGMYAVAKLYAYDDVLSVVLRIPELEPEMIEA